ncbi:MAG: branched-chain amino acid ABC transporter permease [Proteobacteria bacterium]|nr:branched-chain amino acid ABC transporter permease [Pseudomonadota bacterium]
MNPQITPVQLERNKWKANRLNNPAVWLPAVGVLLFILLPMVQSSYFFIDLAAKILIFGLLAASFDIMLGYTGIVSFAHSMFFGFGAYSCALIFRAMPESPITAIVLAIFVATIISGIIAALMALFSLRVAEIFFAMITLAFATFAEVLATEFSGFTGGEDGFSIKLPPYFSVDHQTIFGFSGQIFLYYFILICCTLMLYMIVKYTESPVGRVLKSIRENENRSESLGYNVFHYKLFSTVFSCVLASFCGILFALWLAYVNPDSTLGVAITLNVLIMVLIGGIGTIYGGIIGAFVLQIFESGLPQIKIFTDNFFPEYPILGQIAERWLLLFGLLYVLVVFFFPQGILGSIKKKRAQSKLKSSGQPSTVN